jgi:hypothetical protein
MKHPGPTSRESAPLVLTTIGGMVLDTYMEQPLTTATALANGTDVIGRKVRVIGRGGNITLEIVRSVGTVVRINRNGHPVIDVRGRNYTDRDGCTALLDEDGNMVRHTVTY